jgi:hypothetical protein
MQHSVPCGLNQLSSKNPHSYKVLSICHSDSTTNAPSQVFVLVHHHSQASTSQPSTCVNRTCSKTRNAKIQPFITFKPFLSPLPFNHRPTKLSTSSAPDNKSAPPATAPSHTADSTAVYKSPLPSQYKAERLSVASWEFL